MKHGRNDSCHCGSGRKYKRCCLDADEARESERLRAEAAARANEDVVGEVCEDCGEVHDDEHDPFADDSEDGYEDDGTRDRITALSTTEILDELAGLGIPNAKALLLDAARVRTSAWSVGIDWADGRSFAYDSMAFRVCGLAACELWKRLLPEEPSIEMIDDWVEEAYELLEEDETAEACARLVRAWGGVRDRLTPEITTELDIDLKLELFDDVAQWFDDLRQLLLEEARRDPNWAQIGRDVSQEWLARLTGESEERKGEVRDDLERFRALVANLPRV